jgi:hypothetical protein
MQDIPQWSFLPVVGEWLSYQDFSQFVLIIATDKKDVLNLSLANIQQFPIL